MSHSASKLSLNWLRSGRAKTSAAERGSVDEQAPEAQAQGGLRMAAVPGQDPWPLGEQQHKQSSEAQHSLGCNRSSGIVR